MRGNYSAWAARWRVPLGFAFAIAFAVLSRPTRSLFTVGALIALGGLILRAAAAGHIEKNETLATSGPFRYTRNPLYLGTLILGSGFIIASASWVLAAAFVALFFSIYFPVMHREEQFLRDRFGTEFDAYAARVPLFLPARGWRLPAKNRFRWRRYMKNREYEAAGGWCVVFAFLLVKMMLR